MPFTHPSAHSLPDELVTRLRMKGVGDDLMRHWLQQWGPLAEGIIRDFLLPLIEGPLLAAPGEAGK